MNRRRFMSLTTAAGVLAVAPSEAAPPVQQPRRAKAALGRGQPEQVFPGVWKFTLGSSEKLTPTSTRRYAPAAARFEALPPVDDCPVAVTGSASLRGYLLSVPLQPNEMVYGLGLQLHSFNQRGLKKRLRVNAEGGMMDTGDSHAPVPFYVTTRGYGVLVDTARYATFYCGNKRRKRESRTQESSEAASAVSQDPLAYRFGEPSEVLVEIPEAEGVDAYVFGGPTMRAAVQRYNLFAGGGCLPPRWGLGIRYGCPSRFDQEEVLELAAEFRRRRIPCDVLGLEPGWQTHAYSCSFVWSNRFPKPGVMIDRLRRDHYRLTLWEHAFTHPSSPIYESLFRHSGDFEVFGGLVPDLLLSGAQEIMADFHEKEHVALGVAGYKLDECDNSDFTGNWSFPEVSTFPSGADGEQMHCFFGLRYQDAIQSIFEKRKVRTFGLVRSSHALAAPYPYVLYSDFYDHPEYIRGVAQVGFSGLLWTPEVRTARSVEDLIRRLQTVVFSPLAHVDAWNVKYPPWKQVDWDLNNAGKLDPHWEEVETRCRTVMELRMQLIPYLHAAFVRYWKEGLPPFRALVMDHPDDAETWPVDNQYFMGEGLMIAPVIAGESERKVYLPKGDWFDYWTGERHSGKQVLTISVPLDRIPVFVKGGTVLPLAEAALHADDPAGWRLTVFVYGDGPASTSLYEEDGGAAPALTEVRLAWDADRRSGSVTRIGAGQGRQYEIVEWKLVR